MQVSLLSIGISFWIACKKHNSLPRDLEHMPEAGLGLEVLNVWGCLQHAGAAQHGHSRHTSHAPACSQLHHVPTAALHCVIL